MGSPVRPLSRKAMTDLAMVLGQHDGTPFTQDQLLTLAKYVGSYGWNTDMFLMHVHFHENVRLMEKEKEW